MSINLERKIIGKATLNQVRVSPRKARLVADLVRGQSVEDAIRKIRFSNKKSGPFLERLIFSAVSNAKQQYEDVDVGDMYIATATVDMGKTLKRFIPRAQGRATPIRKRSSHIKIEIGQR